MHLTESQVRVLGALLDGPMTTLEAARRAGTTCLSQRAGELERMGLVVRSRVKVNDHSAKVCQAELTGKGRDCAELLRLGLRPT